MGSARYHACVYPVRSSISALLDDAFIPHESKPATWLLGSNPIDGLRPARRQLRLETSAMPFSSNPTRKTHSQDRRHHFPARPSTSPSSPRLAELGEVDPLPCSQDELAAGDGEGDRVADEGGFE